MTVFLHWRGSGCWICSVGPNTEPFASFAFSQTPRPKQSFPDNARHLTHEILSAILSLYMHFLKAPEVNCLKTEITKHLPLGTKMRGKPAFLISFLACSPQTLLSLQQLLLSYKYPLIV